MRVRWLLFAKLVRVLGAADAAQDDQVESCSYRSFHAHELAVHTHRTFRVDCSSATLPSSTTWSMPSGCVAIEPVLPSAIDVTCSTPGLKVFQVADSSSENASNATRAQLKIRVTNTNLCHDWFIAQVSDTVVDQSLDQAVGRVFLRAWLYTYPTASPEEQSGSACHPSTSSQHLTREFHRLGERPRIQTDSDKSVSAVRIGWDEDRSCWTIELAVEVAIHRHYVRLGGQHIGVLGCHARPRAAVLSVSENARNTRATVSLSAVQGATHWAAVGCGTAGSQPPTITAVAGAPTSTLDTIAGGSVLLGTSDFLNVAFDRCGAFGIATTLLLEDHDGTTWPEAILLAPSAAEPTRVLTLPQETRSIPLEASSGTGCEVVLVHPHGWNVLEDELDHATSILIVVCGQQILVWANDTWTRAGPSDFEEEPAATPSWNAHVRALSSCASFQAWNTPTRIVLWTDEPVTAGGDSELPLYTTSADGKQPAWQQIIALRAFADAHVDIPARNLSATWTVQSAAVMESVPNLIVLLRLNISSARSTSSHLFVFDRARSTWTASSVADAADNLTECNCTMQVAGTSAGTPELYMWGKNLWYSPDGGVNFHRTILLQADGTRLSDKEPSALPSDSCTSACIRSVITSEDGQVVARTYEAEGDRMYWGYVGFPYLVDIGKVPPASALSSISSSASPSPNSIINFDLLGQLVVQRLSHLSRHSNHDPNEDGWLQQTRMHFDSQLVPHDLIRTSETGLHPCPYSHVSSNLPNVVYLDKGESVNARVTVYRGANRCTSPATTSITEPAEVPQLSVSSSDFRNEIVLLSIAENETVAESNLLSSTEVTVSAPRYARRHHPESKSKFDFAAVSAKVSTSSLHCNSDVVSTMAVNVGCPPGRTIRVTFGNEDDPNCDDLPELTEDDLASAEAWRDSTSAYIDAQLPQDSDNRHVADPTVGCARRMYHGSAPWRPRVMLYEWETLIADVTADYIVFERTGRTDYTFNTTEVQAGCISPAQRTESLYHGETYAPCYQGDSSEGEVKESADQLYEILSEGGINALRFTTPGGNGRFEFGLRVVDPSFSHCTLETTFVVDVYGAPIDGRTSLAITLTTIGAISCGLIGSFVCFRRQSV